MFAFIVRFDTFLYFLVVKLYTRRHLGFVLYFISLIV